MLKRILIFSTLLILTACGATKVAYKISFNIDDAEQQSSLTIASLRVIERRLSRMGDQLLEQDMKTRDQEVIISLKIRDKEAGETLTTELVKPFSLNIMEQSPEKTADTVVEDHGGFRKTDITQEHLQWVEARTYGPEGKQGMVILYFSPDGRTIMQKIFKRNKGKAIGIFVRNQLVSKLTVDTDKVKDDIVIQNIPSYEIARMFADDMNVGLHVTFTLIE
ncbi:hypothetical protein A3H22_03420 [Candidatus Peribacteria bacterium RIFCSPLOWO2_12_FULL_55_15]|nr:MAG: hypothetical protein A2789_01055 [Candidatus Peribacteria bacterium RIFCSPHIGHO2_01_FULL_54_22]OGJ62220.1 MAG: hypothetical protein A3D12_00170 [Candidatus Peribacteria bacterium RIFCSPHIGHO2_02_FULL_55_24]OGJ64135.1 MAG: hypothetical protein A3E47_03740 [Candidatus Peribacteria bacterium RIFCSPHIGHO2_12_FULL_54_10]OGJ69060.1 MAG: hypothetical protein A2947_00305 [Candidatus Peribacteria bacterium RIFCSPLOWO2_01_FULL_54_110]OGJ69940.1 MAG: hypothetical protein A3H90_00955 [Candidatus Pe